MDFFHYKIILHLCNFPFWHRGQVFYRWRDSCGFMGLPLLSTLVFVTHRGPLSKNGKCPHAHLLSKKTIAFEKKRRHVLPLLSGRWGWREFLAQCRYCDFLVTCNYGKEAMVATHTSFKPGKNTLIPLPSPQHNTKVSLPWQQRKGLWLQKQK